MSKTGTRREQWLAILKLCGGRATIKDCAQMAIRKKWFPELRRSAELKAFQRDAKRNFNLFDDEGSPSAIAYQEVILDDNGEEISVDTWVQSDLCSLEEWVFTVRSRMGGQRSDAKKTLKIVGWGVRQWPRTAKQAFRRIEQEFGFSLEDVAGDTA